jgi:hypothetical protein
VLPPVLWIPTVRCQQANLHSSTAKSLGANGEIDQPIGDLRDGNNLSTGGSDLRCRVQFNSSGRSEWPEREKSK